MGKAAKMKSGKKQIYNAQGSEAVKAAEDETGEFKKGGKAKKKRKDGGAVAGLNTGGRTVRPRGLKTGGKTPYSSGHSTSMPSEAGKTDSGHEDQRPEGD